MVVAAGASVLPLAQLVIRVLASKENCSDSGSRLFSAPRGRFYIPRKGGCECLALFPLFTAGKSFERRRHQFCFKKRRELQKICSSGRHLKQFCAFP